MNRARWQVWLSGNPSNHPGTLEAKIARYYKGLNPGMCVMRHNSGLILMIDSGSLAGLAFWKRMNPSWSSWKPSLASKVPESQTHQ